MRRAGDRQSGSRSAIRVWLMMRIAALLVAPATVLVATLTGCGSSSNPRIVVFAAASVRKTFTEIGERFKTENPGASIDFSFKP